MTNLKSCDIVYLVKNTEYNGELRYSLRSVCKNFPHRKIWFVGSMPKGIKPDYFQPVNQSRSKDDKYQNVHKLIEAIINNKGISNNFVLFNDDFFVLNPVKQLPVYINGDLHSLIEFVKTEGRTNSSKYINIIERTIEDLTKRKLPCNNFELHIPIGINKIAMKNIMNTYGRFNRSLYGNNLYNPDKTISIHDVKIYNPIQIPTEEQLFVSTTDASFNLGEIGKYIKNKFPEPCEYEYE